VPSRKDRTRDTYVHQPTGPTRVLRYILSDTNALATFSIQHYPSCWPITGPLRQLRYPFKFPQIRPQPENSSSTQLEVSFMLDIKMAPVKSKSTNTTAVLPCSVCCTPPLNYRQVKHSGRNRSAQSATCISHDSRLWKSSVIRL
jgi:hypothetical protein